MTKLDRAALLKFAQKEINLFHNCRISRLQKLRFKEILRKKNPYLFKAKNILTAQDLISGVMDAFLSSSEEKIFGDFLEKLAIFVSSQCYGGKKSSAPGIDLEFDRDRIRFLVSVKSGPSWGNSSQYQALESNFRRAVTVQRQNKQTVGIQPVLGICYGNTRTADKGLYIKYTGQAFWCFLSGDPNLYIDIIEPIGHEARKHNNAFKQEKARLVNRFTAEFLHLFCTEDGTVDWPKLIKFNSGNLERNV